MAKDRREEARDFQRKMDRPPRQQDPYVTGNRGYKQGGEVQGGGSGNNNGGGKAKSSAVIGVGPFCKPVKQF